MKSTLIISLIFLFLRTSTAQWSHDPNVNNRITTATNDQYGPSIVSDGSGGAIAVWQDYRSGNWDIYAQRIDAAGFTRWTANGLAISTAALDQTNPVIASDGAGGAIIAWMDFRNSTNDKVYAQRINANGVKQWTAGGVALSSSTFDQGGPAIASDGAGGAIVTWMEYHSGTNDDLFAQRVNSAGTVVWAATGDTISAVPGDQYDPIIVGDEAGGAIIAWQDKRAGNNDIYAQRVNALGTVQWTANGVAITTAANDQSYPSLSSDSAGGAIIAWEDARNGGLDIYAQRVNASGSAVWTSNGIAISVATSFQQSAQVVADAAGGAVITWQDARSGAWDIYAQRINAAGSAQWTTDGVLICSAVNDQLMPTIASDGAGGAIITWEDYRNGAWDVYAQHINAPGVVQWTTNGVAISLAVGGQSNPSIISGDAGGAIIMWWDNRNGNQDVYGQNVDRNGYLGDARPHLQAVNDVKNDQGGNIEVLWNPSYLDVMPCQVISSYIIYRGVTPSSANQTYAVLTPEEYTRYENTPGLKKPAYLKLSSGNNIAQTIYWENVGSVAAAYLGGYSYDVATLSDSGPQGIPMYYFMVRATTSGFQTFWDSPADSGYSVDNLAPISPQNATITEVGTSAYRLAWNGDKLDKDISHYAVYRSTAKCFLISPTSLLKALCDTTLVDSSAATGLQYYYRVTAIDIHGNESPPTQALSMTPLAVELAGLTASVVPGQGIKLEWTTLSEVDNLGFYVQRRAEGGQAFATVSNLIPGAGTSLQQHQYSWIDGIVTSGTYYYRLMQQDLSGDVAYSNEVRVNGVLGVNPGSSPTEYILHQNHPNPFNPSTIIDYQLPVQSHVTLTVFDIRGREVITLENENKEPGEYQIRWDASKIPSGVYFYRLNAGSFTATRKLLLLK